MAIRMNDDKFQELKSLGGGSLDLIKELLVKFVTGTPRLLNEGLEAVQKNDVKKADYCVHTMKGSSLSLGLTEISDILVALNAKTKQGDLSNAEVQLRQIENLLKEVDTYRKTL